MILKKEKDKDGWSFQILIKGLKFWLEAWPDEHGGWYIDWNQYIFFLNDAEDAKRKAMQEDVENFEFASDLILAEL